jgi:glycosyltransferase involved in cell wall biosynthesis
MTDEISVLVPTYNRSKFLPLFLMNLKSQSYPHDKLKIIIDDDGTDKFIKDINEVRRILHPMQVQYIKDKPKRSIGKKRNDLIKACDTKILCFLDDDDIYMPSYIEHSYNTLKEKKAGCVGSDKMIFCMTDRNFDLHAIDCGNRAVMIHEATMMMTKRWYKASARFANNSAGEGKNIFAGHEKNVAITDIMKCMCCVQHGENTISKLQFAKEENKLDFNISDDFKNILKKILNINT